MSNAKAREYRAVASASAPSHAVLEADLSPIRFRAYVVKRDEAHHLLVQGEAELPEGVVLHVACLFASTKRPAERYVLRGVPVTVAEGRFSSLLLQFPSAPRPGTYIVRVKFSPEKQPPHLRGDVFDLEEWSVAAEIVVDPPSAGGPARERRLAWEVESLAAELARIEEQLETAASLLEQARSDSQRETWRLEVLLLHDLAVLYGRRLALKEEELNGVRTRCSE